VHTSTYSADRDLIVRLGGVATTLLVALVVLLGPAAESAAAAGGTRYLVRRGDTLSDIAAQFGVSPTSVARANGLADPNLVFAGSYLTIPSSGSAGGAGAAGGAYQVQPGDNLTSIAQRYGVSVSALARANGITDPNLVLAGMRLSIPGASGASGGTASSGSSGLPAALRNNPSKYSQYAPIFQRWASTYGIPLDLLKGLCWLESGWQPSVVSKTGAIGMCQFMPATTTFVSGLIGAEMNPWSPNDNVRLSARYLRYLLDRSGGNVRTAVASYYQGFISVTTRGMYTDTVAYVEGVLAFRQRF
jgi:LysM repeat protein